MIDGEMQPYALTLDKFIDHAAKWHPNAEVVTAVENGAAKRITYAALRQRAKRVSAALAERGVRFGTRVATLAWNTQGHLETWYGIMAMGAVYHTLNPRLTAAQLAWMLQQSEAHILIVSVDLMPLATQIAEEVPRLTHILTIDGATTADDVRAGCTVVALDDLLDEARGDVPWGEFDERSPCGLCFTSGTTGSPKGVTYTHRASFLHTLRQLQADVMGIRRTDAIMPVVPMFHANGWGLPFVAPACGAKLVLPGRRTDGASLAQLIRSEGVTVAAAVPTVWLGLVEHLETNGGDVHSLERVMVGGASIPQALMDRIEQRLGVTVQTTWGMTELSPLGTSAPPCDPNRRAYMSGRPAIGIDLLLTDASGCPLPEQRNVEGHLRVRGSSVVSRYFGQETPATDADGWFETGDLARIDDQGNLIITGRAKDLIKSGGEWINPTEIEAIVGALPQVALVAVIGRADPKWGERPILFVELRDRAEITDEELLAPLRGRVAPWWIPDAVVRLPAIPLAATGKIDKQRLRAEYARA